MAEETRVGWNQNFAARKGRMCSTIRALPALQGHRQAEDGEPWSVREGCGPQDAGRVLPPLLHPPHGATEQGSWDGEGWASQQERESFHGPPRPGPARPTLRSPRRGQGPRPGVRSGGAVGPEALCVPGSGVTMVRAEPPLTLHSFIGPNY